MARLNMLVLWRHRYGCICFSELSWCFWENGISGAEIFDAIHCSDTIHFQVWNKGYIAAMAIESDNDGSIGHDKI